MLNQAVLAQQKMNWPDHKKAAIVLTYDDDVISQLNIAIPQLDSAKLKATFFITGDLNRETIPRWRQVAKKGHELANHSLYHPCSSRNDNPVASEDYTVRHMLNEIWTMNAFLFAVDGKSTRTYAYPCTETEVGGKDYVDSLRRSGMIKYARIGGDTEAIVADFKKLDPMKVPSYGLNGNNTVDELIAYVKKVQAIGGMGVIMFHGVGGDYLNITADVHRQLLAYLKQNKKNIWVPTFQESMDYISMQNSRQEIKSND